MIRSIFLGLALLIPIIFVISYSVHFQTEYNHREQVLIPISFKFNEGSVFGFDFNFGFNPCSLEGSDRKTLGVCLKPELQAYLIEKLPSYCIAYIRGFCAGNYFYPRYHNSSSADFTSMAAKQSPIEAVVLLSSEGFGEVVALRESSRVQSH